MANKTFVAYCGGKMECDGYKSPRKQNVSNLHDGYTVSTTAKNQTDADAFIFQQTTDDRTGQVTDVQLHVFKTCCSPRMKCTYSGAGKIITDQTYIWQKVIDNKAIRVMADYDKFTDKDIRIGSYGSGEKYEGFASPSSVEFYFINGNAAGNDIPESTNIGMFEGVTTLTTCNVPCQMRFISENTFKGCTSLTSYSENPDFVDTIGVSAFEDCSGMQTIVIGKNAVISSRSFANCSGADTIEWHNTKQSENKCRMRDIPEGAFAYCSNLRYTKFSGNSSAQDAIIIPRGITGISSNAFTSCGSIKNLYMYDVTKIDDFAFFGCRNLTGITGMSNVTYVGDAAFETVGGIWTTSSMGNLSQMQTIGSGAFLGVSFDGDISLDSCTSLGTSAFERADLYGVTIPYDLNTVPTDCFASATINGTLTINCPNINNSAFAGTTFGSGYSSLDLSNVTGTIACQAFNGSNVTSVVLGDGVSLGDSSCGYGSFEACSSLTSVTFNGTATIGKNTFYNCSSLSTITFSHNVSVGQYSFTDVDLSDIYIDSDVQVSRGSDSFETSSNVPVVHLDYVKPTSGSYASWVQYYEGNNWNSCQIVDSNGTELYAAGRS